MKLHLSNSKGYAFFLAILPLVMMYKVPGIGFGLATTLIAVGMVYAGAVIICRYKSIRFKMLLPIILYFIYVMSKSTGLNMLLSLSILVHLMAIATGAIHSESLRRYIECISVIASTALILQVLIHFLTGFHVPLISAANILDELEKSIPAIKTGYGLEALYRPSAFFLEPAQFTQYCIIGLGSVLFRDQLDIKKALFISIGILFTTSGMGFVLVFAMWGWWYITHESKVSISKIMVRILGALLLVLVLLLVLSRIPYFNNIISRFLVPESESGSYNAVHGRLFWWDTFFGGLSIKDLFWGYGYASLPENYFTGFMTVLYAYGVVGFALLAFVLVKMIFKSNKLSRTFAGIYLGLLFIANLTGFINVIFYFGIIIAINLDEGDTEQSGNYKKLKFRSV